MKLSFLTERSFPARVHLRYFEFCFVFTCMRNISMSTFSLSHSQTLSSRCHVIEIGKHCKLRNYVLVFQTLYWKCNFPINHHVSLLFVWSVVWLVVLSSYTSMLLSEYLLILSLLSYYVVGRSVSSTSS